jgi:hypothetical protein
MDGAVRRQPEHGTSLIHFSNGTMYAASLRNKRRGNTMTNKEAEDAVREVWQNLLHISDIKRETDFFAVGGDSLLGAMLAEAVSEMAGVEVDIMDLFENPTLAQQAALVIKNAVREPSP